MVTSKKTVASKTETPAKTAASKTTTASAKSSATKTAAPKPATKAAAKAPAVKQEAVKQEAVSTPVAAVEPQAAKPVEVSVAAAVTVTISPEQRTNYVQMAAYYIAERRGFAPGNPDEDWLAAEAEVDRLIASGHFSQ